MQVVWFSVVLLCLYLGAVLGFEFWRNRQATESLASRLPAAIAAFLFVPVIIGLSCCSIIFGAPKLSVFTLVACACTAVFYLAARWPDRTKIWIPLLCVASTYVLYKAFPSIPMSLEMYGLLALVWMIVMGLVLFFDRIPLLLFFTFASWTFAFVAISMTGSLFPAPLAVMSAVIFAPLWAVFKSSVTDMKGSLGLYGTAFLGFVMGGMISVCVGYGACASAIALMGYYGFEGLLFCLPYIGLHPLGVQRGEFVLLSVLQKGHPMAVVKTLFYHLIFLSLFAVLAWRVENMFLIILVLGVIFLSIYYRFSVQGAPFPTIRQVWQATRESIKSLQKSNQPVPKQKGTKNKMREPLPQKVSKRKKKK